MGEVVAADRVAVAVATEYEDMKDGPGEREAGGQWQRAAVDEVDAEGVDEVREAGRAADARDADDLLVGDLELLDDVEEGGQDGEVSAGRTPGRVVGLELLLGEFLGGGLGS